MAMQSIQLKRLHMNDYPDQDLNIDQELSKLTESFDGLRIAISSSYLIGEMKLAEAIQEAFEKFNELSKHCVQKRHVYDFSFVQSNINECKEMRVKIHNCCSQAFNSIYA